MIHTTNQPFLQDLNTHQSADKACTQQDEFEQNSNADMPLIQCEYANVWDNYMESNEAATLLMRLIVWGGGTLPIAALILLANTIFSIMDLMIPILLIILVPIYLTIGTFVEVFWRVRLNAREKAFKKRLTRVQRLDFATKDVMLPIKTTPQNSLRPQILFVLNQYKDQFGLRIGVPLGFFALGCLWMEKALSNIPYITIYLGVFVIVCACLRIGLSVAFLDEYAKTEINKEALLVHKMKDISPGGVTLASGSHQNGQITQIVKSGCLQVIESQQQ